MWVARVGDPSLQNNECLVLGVSACPVMDQRDRTPAVATAVKETALLSLSGRQSSTSLCLCWGPGVQAALVIFFFFASTVH